MSTNIVDNMKLCRHAAEIYSENSVQRGSAECSQYTGYKKLCTSLLEEYSKCIVEKGETYKIDCNDKLSLIQKWCMNPVGVVHITPKPRPCVPDNL